MSSTEFYKHFIDCKFDGFEKLKDCCSSNVFTMNKFIRIFKEYYTAQELYSKAVFKSNLSLSAIANNKFDCFHPIFDIFSTAFCVFTNVQKEFTESLQQIIKNLTFALENNEGILSKIFNSHETNVIVNFKNAQIQLNKTKQKYNSIYSDFEKSEKNIQKARESYEESVKKYNIMRSEFHRVMREGFDRFKNFQLVHLESMRSSVKNMSRALSKLIFDMKESADLLKMFYRSNSKEDLFKSWVDSNKTVDDISKDSFQEVVTETILIEINTNPLTNIATSSTHEMKLRKLFQSHRNTINLPNTSKITNKDLTIDMRNTEKRNNTLRISKRRWSGFAGLKRFRSSNNLENVSQTNDSVNEDLWHSKSNLNETVVVDDEGFIVRNETKELNYEQSQSSSSSGINLVKEIKVNIKPVNYLLTNAASKDEVINAGLQLPIPRSTRPKFDQGRRVSNLQRSSRIVTESSRDKFSRRSLSVSEMQCKQKINTNVNEQRSKDNFVIPIACAMTENIASDDGGNLCKIQGQLVLALPTSIKNRILSSSMNNLPYLTVFEFISQSYEFSSAMILEPYQDVVRLERINSNKYSILVLRDLLYIITADQSLSTKENRISFPLLNYFMDVNDIREPVIECFGQWTKFEESFVQFDFTLFSNFMKDDKIIKIKIKLITEGTIEAVSSDREVISDRQNSRYWTLNLGKSDQKVSVKIRNDNNTVVKLKFSYEFIFENCSLIKPQFLLKSIEDVDPSFKISLIHYRTISSGHFQQFFEFDLD